jgi:hypothetical protein
MFTPWKSIRFEIILILFVGQPPRPLKIIYNYNDCASRQPCRAHLQQRLKQERSAVKQIRKIEFKTHSVSVVLPANKNSHHYGPDCANY